MRSTITLFAFLFTTSAVFAIPGRLEIRQPSSCAITGETCGGEDGANECCGSGFVECSDGTWQFTDCSPGCCGADDKTGDALCLPCA